MIVMIRANKVKIGKNVEINQKADILCDTFEVGDGTVIKNVKIQCRTCKIGRDCFIWDGVWIQGSFNAGDTTCIIGDECLICENTRVNCNDPVTIGNDVNIGQNVSIWTHASSMDVTMGYPWTKAPVTIGNHVWITAGVQILPGLTIGHDVIIGNGAIVNTDIPSNSFAAGVPAKVKTTIKPKPMTDKDLVSLMETIVSDYLQKKHDFEKNFTIEHDAKRKTITIHDVMDDITVFDYKNKTIEGRINFYSNDFRDYLRYRGIKISGGVPFKSIKPKWARQALRRTKPYRTR